LLLCLGSDFNNQLASYPRQNALALALREFGGNSFSGHALGESAEIATRNSSSISARF
jgi:hypothetical protein